MELRQRSKSIIHPRISYLMNSFPILIATKEDACPPLFTQHARITIHPPSGILGQFL